MHKKKLLVLDLDGTLIYCGDDNVIKKRPHFDHFMQVVSEIYDLAIWSANGHDYINMIIEHVMPKQKLQMIYGYEKCKKRTFIIDGIYEQDHLTKIIKPLKKIWHSSIYTSKDTLILDDTPYTYRENYGNAISIISWRGEDNNDEELLRVIKILIKMLPVDDVRKAKII